MTDILNASPKRNSSPVVQQMAPVNSSPKRNSTPVVSTLQQMAAVFRSSSSESSNNKNKGSPVTALKDAIDRGYMTNGKVDAMETASAHGIHIQDPDGYLQPKPTKEAEKVSERSRAFFLPILWPIFGYTCTCIPNGKSSFFQIFYQNSQSRRWEIFSKCIVKSKCLEGLKQERLLHKWKCKWNLEERYLGKSSEYSKITLSNTNFNVISRYLSPEFLILNKNRKIPNSSAMGHVPKTARKSPEKLTTGAHPVTVAPLVLRVVQYKRKFEKIVSYMTQTTSTLKNKQCPCCKLCQTGQKSKRDLWPLTFCSKKCSSLLP